jgi:hypothetical protein
MSGIAQSLPPSGTVIQMETALCINYLTDVEVL